MTRFSYRVAYRREGGHRLLTRHYETYSLAWNKVRRLKSIEAARIAGDFEGTSFEDMPPLVELRLERRRVEAWEENPWQPECTEYDLDAARSYADRLRDQQAVRPVGEFDGGPF